MSEAVIYSDNQTRVVIIICLDSFLLMFFCLGIITYKAYKNVTLSKVRSEH